MVFYDRKHFAEMVREYYYYSGMAGQLSCVFAAGGVGGDEGRGAIRDWVGVWEREDRERDNFGD